MVLRPLKQETSRRKIEELFFRTQYGLEVVVPATRPILPWLALFDEKIRDRVCRVAPEVLFEGGDPSQLPLETRREILQQVCNRLASEASSSSMADHAAVQRFANVDLTADIKELIHKFEANDDLLWFLLRMVWQGELVGALPEAWRVALSPSSGHYARIAAFRAVSALGSADDKAELRRNFQNERAVLDRDWLGELLKTTELTNENIDWLFECLRKVGDKEQYSVDNLTEQLSKLVERAEYSMLPSIIDRANALLEEPPVVEHRHCEVSAKYTWLLKAAGIAVELLVKSRNEAALESSCLAVLHKLPISKQYNLIEVNDSKVDFGALVPEWRELNLALFWYLVDHERKWLDRKKNERLTDWFSVSIWSSYVQFSPHYFELLLKDVATRPFIDDKLVALSLAYKLYSDAGRRIEQRMLLKKVVHGNSELFARLSELIHPPRQSAEARKYKKMEAGWKRRDEVRRQKEQANRDEWRKYVTENVEKLRDPRLDKPEGISNAQYYLHEQMRQGRQEASVWSDGKWQFLEIDFGVEVARAFRDGAIAYWRRNKPKLVSEGAPSNSTPPSTIFGLTGLAIEAREAEGWPKALNEAGAYPNFCV